MVWGSHQRMAVTSPNERLFVCLFVWVEFYAQSASKAIFRARTHDCITYSVRWWWLLDEWDLLDLNSIVSGQNYNPLEFHCHSLVSANTATYLAGNQGQGQSRAHVKVTWFRTRLPGNKSKSKCHSIWEHPVALPRENACCKMYFWKYWILLHTCNDKLHKEEISN